jgi:hypothetical protein
MGARIEATPYTGESTGTGATILTASDYNFAAEKITYDPEIEQKLLEIARGDFSKTPSIPGKKKFSFTCQIPAGYTTATAATMPGYGKFLQSAGMATATTATTTSFTTHADMGRWPLTVEFQEKGEGMNPNGLLIVGKGCMCKLKGVIANIGEPLMYDIAGEGSFVGIFDRPNASMITPTGFNTSQPEAVLSATFALFGETQKASKFTLDLGNKVEEYINPADASGYEGAHIVDRNPKITLDPDLDSLSNRGNYARLTGATTGTMLITVGSHIQISVPAGQITKAYKPGSRAGHVVNELEIEPRRGTTGNDEIVITHI